MELEGLVEPPNYYTTEHIFDICFHPTKDFISYSNIDGEVRILQCNSEDTEVVFQKKIFEESARCLLFDGSGDKLITGGKNGSLVLLDASGKVISTIDKAHGNPVYSLHFLDDNIVASGDDDGAINVWDLRSNQCVFGVYEQKEGTITQMAAHSSLHYLLASSTSGLLGVYDLRKDNKSKEKLYAMSDQMEEEYLCLSLVKEESKVLVGTSSGAISVFSWDWFGDSKDRIGGHPEGVECMLSFNENVVITGCEDGWVRVVGLYPHAVNLFQKHADDMDDYFAVSQLDLNHDGKVLASISHDCSICFYDMTNIWEKIDQAQYGTKLALEEDKVMEPLKAEMAQKFRNKDKQDKLIVEKRKKAEFFKDF